MNAAAVIGLGLIGGSVAREFAARGIRVLGFDRDSEQLAVAMRDGAVSAALTPDLHGTEGVDVVVVAVPPGALPQVLSTLAPHLGQVRLVMDVGSTKRSAVAAAAALGIERRFVGSHPLAGDHRSGWAASRLGLFQGARVFLCAGETTAGDSLAAARELWTTFGALPEVINADEHDRQLAWTSHLPQMLSTALAITLSRAGIDSGQLGPGGRDMTRLAGSAPELWTDIALDNASELLPAIRAMQRGWLELDEVLSSGDRAQVCQLFMAGNQWANDPSD